MRTGQRERGSLSGLGIKYEPRHSQRDNLPARQTISLRERLTVLGAVEDAENDNLMTLRINLMHDDIGETVDDPFVCAGNDANMANLRKLGQALAIREYAIADMSGCRRTFGFDVGVDCRYVAERFKSEAQRHMCDCFLMRLTSSSVARRVLPSRRAP